jgi:ABC-type glycerol-3-phosphate transport system substrate-binding protein
MTALIPAELAADVPQGIWDSITYDGQIYASPTLLQSYVVFANKTLLDEAGIALPTIDAPWTWDDFAANAKALTGDGQYGLCWGLRSAGALVMSTSLNYGGTFFATEGDTTTFTFGPAEQQVPTRIHAMAYTDGSIAPDTIGASGSDNLAVFLAGTCAMFVGGNFYAQQLTASAPEGFEWVMLPLLKGDTQAQNANPQTLSIAAQSEHPAEAMQFITFFSNAQNLASVAQGDWLAPATTSAGDAVLEATGGASGWDVIVSSSKLLEQAPFQKLEGYPQWKDQTLNPSFQQYFANEIDLAALTTQLTDGWNAVVAGG